MDIYSKVVEGAFAEYIRLVHDLGGEKGDWFNAGICPLCGKISNGYKVGTGSQTKVIFQSETYCYDCQQIDQQFPKFALVLKRQFEFFFMAAIVHFNDRVIDAVMGPDFDALRKAALGERPVR